MADIFLILFSFIKRKQMYQYFTGDNELTTTINAVISVPQADYGQWRKIFSPIHYQYDIFSIPDFIIYLNTTRY